MAGEPTQEADHNMGALEAVTIDDKSSVPAQPEAEPSSKDAKAGESGAAADQDAVAAVAEGAAAISQ